MATEPGVKLDQGKNRIGLMVNGFAAALWQVGEVATFGANKYTPGGWRTVENGAERYKDAAYRHLLAVELGEAVDAESGLPHLAHAAWNILAMLELSASNTRRENL